MSAIACYWPETGRLEVLSVFPNEPSLSERGLRDGVGRLYIEGARRGELIQVGGSAVDISELLQAALRVLGHRPLSVWIVGDLPSVSTRSRPPAFHGHL